CLLYLQINFRWLLLVRKTRFLQWDAWLENCSFWDDFPLFHKWVFWLNLHQLRWYYLKRYPKFLAKVAKLHQPEQLKSQNYYPNHRLNFLFDELVLTKLLH